MSASSLRNVLLASSLAALASSGVAHADSTSPQVDQRSAKVKHEKTVLGGNDAPKGKWPDAAAVLFDGQQACTGTLIAPTLVVSAGHCEARDLDGVLVGTTSLARPEEGETIGVVRQIPYPNSWNTFDAMILELERPSTIAPRTIATGWARFDIVNGADVAIVGYGAIDRNANQYIDELQEAFSTITDGDCTTSDGCNEGARPKGELGAGGMGIDSCSGDSGGPLYLLTDYGSFLAGITSRSYDNPRYYCSEGGIYVRPDALVPWIEEQTGVTLARGPVPSAELLVAESGGKGTAQITTNDPRAGASHVYRVVTDGAHGTATVDDAGVVTFEAEEDYLGPDTVEVEVVDAADPERLLRVTVTVDVVEPVDDGCGCRSGGNAGGLVPVLMVALGLLWRRRRSAAALA